MRIRMDLARYADISVASQNGVSQEESNTVATW